MGLPLLPSVRKAAEVLRPDATAVFVAAHQAGRAIEDAIEAEVPLIVAVAEFIPLHDILRVCAGAFSDDGMGNAKSYCRFHRSSRRSRNHGWSVPIHRASSHPLADVA